MTILFITCFAIGVLALLGSLIIGELGGSDVSGHVGDGAPFLSLTTIATAIFGFGSGGLGADLVGLSAPVAIGAGVALAVALVAVFRGVLLPYLLRQQSNSHFSRASYIGLIGRVEMTIPVDGWGEVSVVDPTGSRVRVKAVSDEGEPLTIATPVYIADVDAEFVHVVAVPELD